MKRLILLSISLIVSALLFAGPKVIKISVVPAEAAIYVNNNFVGYGYAEFTKPKKKEVAVIKIECNEYNTIVTKFYGTDKRTAISYTLQQDGFFRASAASGIVNKFFTVDIDSMYYQIENGKVDISKAWKLLHQILLNYFAEIATTDFDGGYVQTPWQYKTFTLSEKQIRNRVTIRDISTPSHVAMQIKIESEVANAAAAKHGEFEAVDRVPKEFETIIQELQTRIGKVSSL
ncbi:MAG: hypothetical protein U0K35_01830 [Prevotella sp.]|nr:hypothetical protein [Prevotella sp.]